MAGSSVRDILENISANLLDDLLDICAGDMPLTRVGRIWAQATGKSFFNSELMYLTVHG
jgi:hypothetical protein